MSSFDKYFELNIASYLPEMEQKRRKLSTIGKRRMKFLNISVTIITGILSIYYGFYFSSFMVFFCVAFGILIAMVLFQDQIKAFLLRNDGLQKLKQQYKSRIISRTIQFFSEDWSYNPKGKLSKQELTESQLFHIGINTKIETDDTIKGKWNDHEILMANVKTTSVRESDPARVRKSSGQSFNGLFVRLKKEINGNGFIIPTAKTTSGIGGLANMKLKRDPGMSIQEQKAHNLVALGEGIGSYYWNTNLSPLKDSLTKYEINDSESKEYQLYTNTKTFYQQLIQNVKLRALMNKAFSDKGAIEELSKTQGFKLLNKHLMDQVVRTTLTYAIHSGYVWVLIPAFEEKFELSLDREISKETVLRNYGDIELALVSLSPFIHN